MEALASITIFLFGSALIFVIDAMLDKLLERERGGGLKSDKGKK